MAKRKIESILDNNDTHIVNESELNKYDDSNKPDSFLSKRLLLYRNWFRAKYKIVISNNKFYKVSYDPRDTSNLGCGYTKYIYIVANSINDVTRYCKSKFGNNVYVTCQWGTVKFRKYSKNVMTEEMFFEEVKKLSWRHDYYNSIKGDSFNGYKINERGEYVFAPEEFDVVSLIK